MKKRWRITKLFGQRGRKRRLGEPLGMPEDVNLPDLDGEWGYPVGLNPPRPWPQPWDSSPPPGDGDTPPDCDLPGRPPRAQ